MACPHVVASGGRTGRETPGATTGSATSLPHNEAKVVTAMARRRGGMTGGRTNGTGETEVVTPEVVATMTGRVIGMVEVRGGEVGAGAPEGATVGGMRRIAEVGSGIGRRVTTTGTKSGEGSTRLQPSPSAFRTS